MRYRDVVAVGSEDDQGYIGVATAGASGLIIHGMITTAVGIAFCNATYHGHGKASAAGAIPAPAGGRSPVTG